jgi:hypothetical protein
MKRFNWLVVKLLLIFGVEIGVYANNVTGFTINGKNYNHTDNNYIWMTTPLNTFYHGENKFDGVRYETIFTINYEVDGVSRITIPDSHIGESIEIYNLNSMNKIFTLDGTECSDTYFCGSAYLTKGEYAFIYKSQNSYDGSKNNYDSIKFDFFPETYSSTNCSPIYEALNGESCKDTWKKAEVTRFTDEMLENAKNTFFIEGAEAGFANLINLRRRQLDNYMTVVSIGKSAVKLGVNLKEFTRVQPEHMDLVEGFFRDSIKDEPKAIVEAFSNQFQKNTFADSTTTAQILSTLVDHAATLVGVLIPPPNFYGAAQTLIGDIGILAELTYQTIDLNKR